MRTKRRMKRKCWTKLKSGLFGWRITTEANTKTSDVAKLNKTHAQSDYPRPANNLMLKNCPNESSVLLLIDNNTSVGGKNELLARKPPRPADMWKGGKQ